MKMTAETFFRKAMATLLGIGYLPFMPGTMGSIAVVAALGFVHGRIPGGVSTGTMIYWIVCLCAITLSFIFSARSHEIFGREDPGCIVIDEAAGQLITFLFVPLTWRTLVLGCVLFRCFDIIKPFPVSTMEEMEDGVGVTMDDVAAGVFANITLLGLLFLYTRLKGVL